MKPYHIHIADVDWKEPANERFGPLKVKELINRNVHDAAEFTFGIAELSAGDHLPLHTHQQAHCDYFLSGRIWVRLGRQRIELGSDSAAYFSARIPHAYEPSGRNPVQFLYVYACETAGDDIRMLPADETSADEVVIPNMSATRWAVASDFDPWELWEPSLGQRGIHWKNLFDHVRGGHTEMMVGVCFLPPGSRYTRHFHDQPEIYYVLSGHGDIYAGDDAYKATPGSFVYLPKKCIHGAVTHGNQPLKMLYVFGTETVGSNYDRSFVENVALEASRK